MLDGEAAPYCWGIADGPGRAESQSCSKKMKTSLSITHTTARLDMRTSRFLRLRGSMAGPKSRWRAAMPQENE